MNPETGIALCLIASGIIAYFVLNILYEFWPDINEYYQRKDLEHWQRVWRRKQKRKKTVMKWQEYVDWHCPWTVDIYIQGEPIKRKYLCKRCGNELELYQDVCSWCKLWIVW